MILQQHGLAVVSLAIILSAGISCKKKSSDDPAVTPTTGTTTDSDPEETNALAGAYPDSLALTVFPSDAASLRLVLADSTEVEDPNFGRPSQEMIEENKKILTGESDTCLDPSLFKPFKDRDAVTCYEFDSDMNPASNPNGNTYGTTDGSDGNGEACMVAFTRNEAQTAIALVQKALAIVGGMICQAKKVDADIAMPEEGDELNLKDAMTAAAGKEMPVTEAKIEAIEGTALVGSTTSTAYRSTVKMKDPRGNAMEVYLTHQKTDDGENGTLAFKRPAGAFFTTSTNDPNNSANKDELLSITYELSGSDDAKNAKIELRRAAIVRTVSPFNSDGLVNLEGVSTSASNSTIHAINLVQFDINPDTSAGNFSYWQNPGGGNSEDARGFVYNVEEDADTGLLSGCGVSGSVSGISIRKSLTDGTADLEATGWWHPAWSSNTNANKDTRYNATRGNKVTKQCFAQNADKVYEITTDDSHGYELVLPANSGITPPTRPTPDLPPPPSDIKPD